MLAKSLESRKNCNFTISLEILWFLLIRPQNGFTVPIVCLSRNFTFYNVFIIDMAENQIAYSLLSQWTMSYIKQNAVTRFPVYFCKNKNLKAFIMFYLMRLWLENISIWLSSTVFLRNHTNLISKFRNYWLNL